MRIPSPLRLDRRAVLAAFAAAAAPALARGQAGRSPGLDGLFADAADFILVGLPEQATSTGLDVGARVDLRSRLTDRSHAGRARFTSRAGELLQRAKAFDPARIRGLKRAALESLTYWLAEEVSSRRFPTWDETSGQISPYAVTQLTGAYQQVPDFLDSQHPIRTRADAEAYLERLHAFAKVIDQDTQRLRADSARGYRPPDFCLGKALVQLTELRATPADKANLVGSLVRRAKDAGIDGDFASPARKILEARVYPALDRQIAAVRAERAKAVHDAGVWRLPEGEALYAEALRQNLTTGLSHREVHRQGLELQARLSAELDASLKAQGLTQGSVGARLRGLYDDPKFRYPNTDEAKERMLNDLRAKIAAIRARLPQAFGALPKAEMVVKRVPAYLEAGAPGGYAVMPSIDGSRPGLYYINLRDTAETPSWTLPTLTFHEGIPGHYLQGALENESADLPLVQKILGVDVNLSGFNAYAEGWALYSEQLADELGMYADDPFGRIGYLHDACFRAVRMVVDTGMHAMHWSREQAVRYMVEAIGDQESGAAGEIERYAVWPGQACSYMVGKLTFLRLRDEARRALGSRFDIHAFHDAVLLAGGMPLDVLKGVVRRYIASA